MLLLIAALTFVQQDAAVGKEIFGKYLDTNLTTKPECNKPGDRYLTISPGKIEWSDGKTGQIVNLEVGDRDHYHLWIKDDVSGKVILYGVYVDRKYDNAIVISDERVEMQARVDVPEFADAGIVGSFARCNR